MPLKQKTVVNNFYLEQRKDSNLRELCDYLECGTLPENSQSDVRQLVAKAMHFTIVDHVLYFVDHQWGNRKRAAVPVHLQEQILLENHGGIMAGHFSGRHNAFTTLLVVVGGGTHCIMIPLNSAGTVRNVQLCQVTEGGTNHPCTLSQFNDHSRS